LYLTFGWNPRYSIGVSNREAKADVLQGALDIMILQTLATLGPSHGYAIAARIEQVSNGRMQLTMGTLYPGLMRLEQRRAIRGSWGTPITTARRASTISRQRDASSSIARSVSGAARWRSCRPC